MGNAQSRKGKQPRNPGIFRVNRILERKEKRLRNVEAKKYIEINGKKILKPQWRNR